MLRNMLGLGMLLNTKGFKEGQQAAHDGCPVSDNPYAEGHSQRSDWQLGWSVATRMAADKGKREIALRAPARSAYDLGRAAAEEGLSASVNPFHNGHPAHDEWRLGWAHSKAA